jgi:hypothetical protein
MSNYKTYTEVEVNGEKIQITGVFYKECGDGWNDPIEPAHWELVETIYKGVDSDPDDFAQELGLTSDELYEIFYAALDAQDERDWDGFDISFH